MATYEKYEEKCSSNTDISSERNNLLGEKKKSFLWHLLKHLLHHNFLVTLSGDIKDTGKSRNLAVSQPHSPPHV